MFCLSTIVPRRSIHIRRLGCVGRLDHLIAFLSTNSYNSYLASACAVVFKIVTAFWRCLNGLCYTSQTTTDLSCCFPVSRPIVFVLPDDEPPLFPPDVRLSMGGDAGLGFIAPPIIAFSTVASSSFSLLEAAPFPRPRGRPRPARPPRLPPPRPPVAFSESCFR